MEAAEYEFLNDTGGLQRGDQQTLAPATEEQAAAGHMPDELATAEGDDAAAREDDDNMIVDEQQTVMGAEKVSK